MTGSLRLYRQEHFSGIDWNDTRPRLIKIHSTIDDAPSLAATLAGVAARDAARTGMSILEHVFGTAGGAPTLEEACEDPEAGERGDLAPGRWRT